MKARGFVLVSATAAVALAGLGVGGYSWSLAHERRWSGQPGLGLVSCDHCHLGNTDKLPWSRPHPKHASPAALAVSADGQRLYIALDELDEVVEADVTSGRVLRRAPVPGGPFGLALDRAGGRLYVACRRQDRVAVVETGELKELASVDVGMMPVALALAQGADGGRLIVLNSGSDDASVLSLSPLKELVRPATGREPYAVSVSADGKLAFIVSRLAEREKARATGDASGFPFIVPQTADPYHVMTPSASELTVLFTRSGRVFKRAPLESAHLSEGIAGVPTRGWMLAPLVKVRNLVPITQVANGWVMSTGLAVSDLLGHVTQLPLDEANDYFADPSGIAVDAAGQRAYVASGGSDVISVVDLGRVAEWLAQADAATRERAIEDLTLSSRYVLARIPTGRNPRHVALSPDGRKLFVSVRLEDKVQVLDTETLKPAGEIVLDTGGDRDPIRRGERVFTKAAHTFQRQFSCRSCHPDAHVDGLAYDFDGDGIGDNLLDNRSLQGLAGTAPFKWNGKNPTLQVQCGPRFARVLMRTDAIPPDDLNDLVTYLLAQPPPRTLPYKRIGRPLTPSEDRGRKLFFATQRPEGTPIPRERQCQTCHRPPLFTNRLPGAVGSKGPRDSTDEFDTPHLLGIAASAPYLHDGRARTLEELWTTYQTNDLHGVSSYWSKHQLNDLIAYLKTL